MRMKGSSTGRAPIHLRSITTATRNQKPLFTIGFRFDLVFLVMLLVSGSVYKTRTAIARAITPPSLLGIDRKMA